jgi:hypothetical protein
MPRTVAAGRGRGNTNVVGELDRIAADLAAYLRRERVSDPTLHRLLAELESLARNVADRGRPIDAEDGPPESVAQYAERTGTPARTVRRWCSSGRLPATWGDGRWWIKLNSSIEHDGSRPRAASRKP